MPSRAWFAAVGAALALAGCGDDDEALETTPARPTPAPPNQPSEPGGPSADVEQLEFPAEGGATISATFTPSAEPGRSPAVILVHQFSSDRSDWDELVPELTERGWATLAYDIRGMGESRAPDEADVATFPLDVEAAIAALRRRDDVDPERVAAVGASVGADTVFVAAGSGYGLAGAVVLSPSVGRGLDGDGVDGFDPRGVLFVADGAEIEDSRALAARTGEPKRVLQAGTDGHGIALLADDEVRAAALGWLEERLAGDDSEPNAAALCR